MSDLCSLICEDIWFRSEAVTYRSFSIFFISAHYILKNHLKNRFVTALALIKLNKSNKRDFFVRVHLFLIYHQITVLWYFLFPVARPPPLLVAGPIKKDFFAASLSFTVKCLKYKKKLYGGYESSCSGNTYQNIYIIHAFYLSKILNKKKNDNKTQS